MSTERGSITPLVAGILAITAVFTISVIDSTDLALTRTRLQSLADGAALAGAQSFTPAAVAFTATGVAVTLSPAAASSAARTYLTDSGTTGVTVKSVSVPDAHTAVVTLSQLWSPPFVSDFIPLTVHVTATARARTRLG